MKKILLLLAFSLTTISSWALPDYESFSDATGAGGTSYSVGSNLAGQTNASGLGWYLAGTGTTQPTIVAGDLYTPGLASSFGGQSAAFGGLGNNARLNMSVGAGGVTSGTIYYSFSMKLTDLTGLNAGGVFWAGLNNTQGAQGTVPNTVATRLVTRTAGAGQYNIGLDKASGTTGSFVWTPGNFTTASTVFVVGSYTFNSSTTTDDVSQMWVNPDSSTFAAGTAPTADATSTAGTDLARVASFVLYDRSANEPAGGQIDDLRFGLTWADVTPVPEPTSLAIGALCVIGLGFGRRLRKSR